MIPVGTFLAPPFIKLELLAGIMMATAHCARTAWHACWDAINTDYGGAGLLNLLEVSTKFSISRRARGSRDARNRR
eukprot:SAG31_NODE_17347_length_674_cov_1.083478_1_plen_76_part_00